MCPTLYTKRKIADMRYGKYQITEEERADRERGVKQILAILRLEGQCPGPHGMALYQKYIDGDYTYEECLELKKKVSLMDVKLLRDELYKKYNLS